MGRLKFPYSRRKLSSKNTFHGFLYQNLKIYENAVSAGKTIFHFANDKGVISIVGVFVATVPYSIVSFFENGKKIMFS